MQNKLQELTDKLYEQGLSKGKQEAQELMQKAQADSKTIIEQAELQAKQILEEAKKQAGEIISKTEADVRMATKQSILAIRQEVEKSINLKLTADNTKNALMDINLVTDIIKTIAASYNPEGSEPTSLELLLPQAIKDDFNSKYENSLRQELTNGLNISFSKSIGTGFKIGPSKEGYLISFTDEDFINIFAEYLRPQTKNLLFEK